MLFFFTLAYVAFALITPGALGEDFASLHVMEILAGLIILTAIPKLPEAKLGGLPGTWLMLGLIFSTMVSMMATGWFGGVLPSVINLMPPTLTVFFILLSCRSLKRLRILVYVLLGSALFIFYHGLLADLSGQHVTNDYIFMEGPTLVRYRGLGILNDPNDLAQFYAMLVPLLWLRWKKGATFANLLLTILPSVALCIAIFLTHSRGAVVAMLAIVIFTFKDKIGLVLSSVLAGGAMIGVTALNMTGGRDLNSDDGDRIGLWSRGLTVFKTHPLFGVGINNFMNFTDNGLTAHNSYVLVLAELGLFGALFWFGLLTFSWGTLAAIIQSGKSALARTSPVPEEADPLRFARTPWQAAPSAAGSSVMAPESFLRNRFEPPAMLSPAPSSPMGPGEDVDAREPSPGDPERAALFAQYARVLRIAFVGFLVTAFFISRTYSIVLFILLGLSNTLHSLYQEEFPDFHPDPSVLTRRTFIALACAVAFLYVFVRLRGGS